MSWSSHYFFFNDTATTEIYTLSLHDALPIYSQRRLAARAAATGQSGTGFQPVGAREEFRIVWRRKTWETGWKPVPPRSEEHTSELQSPCNLVCRLLLEKKKQKKQRSTNKFRT